jgi:hypothetical protein
MTSRHDRIGSLRGDDNFFYSLTSELAGPVLKKQLDGLFDIGQSFFSCPPLANGPRELDTLHHIPPVLIFV